MREWAWCTEPVDELAMATLLQASLRVSVESDVFGTPACRAAIIGHSGELTAFPWPTPLPLTLDVAHKLARYMGAGNGEWNAKYTIDVSPNNHITMFRNVTNATQDPSVYSHWWRASLTYVQNHTRRTLFYPALHTVYPDDTSVLTSIVTVLACCQLEKVAQASWREYSGVSIYTPKQIEERTDKYIRRVTERTFAGRFVIEPRTYHTAEDLANGFGRHCDISIYANNMRTVGNYSIVARRMASLITG